jgi:2-keto-4-pentenoate hydratase/2-oxohepta-3-ene-1,7-dioic acid hydratase in catechol pathway
VRFLSFRIDGEHKYGAVIENRVVELSSRMSNHATLLDVMADGALVRAKDIAAESSADYELKEIEFLPPIVNPGKIVCVSENYAAASESPEVSFPSPDSFVGHGESLRLPPEGSPFDCEAEFALIVSGGGRRIPEKAARSAIAGVTLACVGAVKEASDDTLDNPSQGKHLAASCAIGPWLVTVDDIPDLDNITVSAHINEALQGHYSSSDLQLSFAPLISYLSTFMPLNPGDVILTRAPRSAAAEKPSTLHLKSGDRLIVHSDDIGTLENPVMDDGGEPQ